MLQHKSSEEFVHLNGFCNVTTTQAKSGVDMSDGPHALRVMRINFSTGMIEMDPYPITEFVRDMSVNRGIVPEGFLATTMGAAWGHVWKDFERAIEERNGK